jgi:hypothetical protein
MDQLYLPPSLRRFEPLRVLSTVPMDHMCFEYDLVEALRPRTVVDLGAGDAASFFVFCQSMRDHDIDGVCFAVDEWQDDAKKPEEDETHSLSINHHARTYHRGIAYLSKLSPDNALTHFAEGTIDLLRIDAQRVGTPLDALVDAWTPRVAPGGVVLCPGVLRKDGDLGAAWERVTRRRRGTTFERGFGLGVLRDDRAPAGSAAPPLLALLGSTDPADRRSLEAFYAHASEHHALRRAVRPYRFNLGKKKPAGQG